MGWETRARGGRYYTRSRKVGGRVVREYVGGGLLGEMAAASDAAERVRQAEDAAALRAAAERDAALAGAVAELDAAGESLARAALYAAGYRRHHRGEWRKHRAETEEG